ncbi:calcium-binding protein [Methylomagnum ishizawai]|nr:calcium-binding protein [Methylomagnum ishizawai]
MSDKFESIESFLIDGYWNGYKAPSSPLNFSYTFNYDLSLYNGYIGLSKEDYFSQIANAKIDTINLLSKNQKTAVDSAVKAWGAVAKIIVVENSSIANISIFQVGFNAKDQHRAFTVSGVGPNSPDGDIMLNNEDVGGNRLGTENQQADPGQIGYYVILHELGHAFGLKHPIKSGPEDNKPYYKFLTDYPELYHNPDNLSVKLYSVMFGSVQNDYQKDERLPKGWLPSTPMLFDIAAVQKLYGANPTTGSDDEDIYKFNEQKIDDNTTITNAAYTIWDADGENDTIDASDQTVGVHINLEPGRFSWTKEKAVSNRHYIAIAYNPTGAIYDNNYIEDAKSGDGNDDIIGNDGNNKLTGGKGNDTLDGGKGDDTLYGGPDNDRLYGGPGQDRYIFKQGENAGSDYIIDYGGDKHDGDGNGQLFYRRADGKDAPLGGNIPASPTGKRGECSGGDGEFIYKFSGEIDDSGAIPADSHGVLTITSLNDPAFKVVLNDFMNGEFGITLQPAPVAYIALNNISTGTGVDNYKNTGDANNNKLLCGPGEDRLEGQDGNDALMAREGNDGLYGGEGNDYLDGGVEDDYLEGGNGNDFLNGCAGADTVRGGDGSDYIFGDADLVVYFGNSFNFGVNPSDPVSWGVYINEGVVSWQSAWGYTSITLPDENSDDHIEAGAGNDEALAGPGDDYVDGGDGGDVIDGGSGGDILLGGKGNDLIIGDGSRGGIVRDIILDPISETLGIQAVDLFPPLPPGSLEVQEAVGNTLYLYVTSQNHGDDYLDGGDGNDSLYGDGGNDILYGGAGDDKMIGDGGYGDSNSGLPSQYHGDDYLDGGDGKDDITGGGGNDVLKGGAGDDRLFGDSDDVAVDYRGDDALDGGAGDDYLRGYEGDDVLEGGDGADRLEADAGNDALSGGEGDDILFGVEGDDSLDGGEGDDTLYGDMGNDILYGGDGTDILVSDDGDDRLDGGGGNDILGGGIGNDILSGGLGNDQAVGGDGADQLDGGDGDDVLLGDMGDDTLAGSLGNDQLQGGDGVDLLDGGDGDDVLFGDTGDDTLAGGLHNDQLQGGDGADLLDSGDGDDVLFGDGDDDTLYGSGGNDVLSGGDGNDDLEDVDGSNSLDGGAGDDRLIAGAGDDSLRAGDGDDWLEGNGGNDYYYGGGGADTYKIVSGSALIQDHDGANTLILAGSGVDLGNSHGAGSTNPTVGIAFSIVNFGGTSPDPIEYGFDGSTNSAVSTYSYPVSGPYLRIQTSDAIVFIEGGLGANLGYLIDGRGNQTPFEFILDQLAMAQGGGPYLGQHSGNWVGTAGNDIANTGLEHYHYVGGTGDDIYYFAGHGNGLYYAKGDGHDVIVGVQVPSQSSPQGIASSSAPSSLGEPSAQSQVSTNSPALLSAGTSSAQPQVSTGNFIRFGAGLNSTNAILSRAGDDLLVAFDGTADQVTVTGYFQDAFLESIEFGDGVLWDATDIANHLTSQLGNGNDVFTGTDYGERILALGGNDAIYGMGGDDTLDGGVGDDNLNGGSGNDTYLFGPGSGQDTVYDYDPAHGNSDTVLMAVGVLPADVAVTGDGTNLYLSLGGGTDRLTLANWLFAFSSNYQIERVAFADGTVWEAPALLATYLLGTNQSDQLVGDAGANLVTGQGGSDVLFGYEDNDTLDGGTGNDQLYGGDGDDTYIFGRGYGMDTLYETASGSDKVLFGAGIQPGDISVGWDDTRNDLILTVKQIGGLSDYLEFKDYLRFDDGRYRVEQFVFADGTVWDIDKLKSFFTTATPQADNLRGFHWDDSLDGLAGNDILQGYEGNDALRGGTGNDQLYGGSGDDIYVFTRGDGQDRITEESGIDSIQLDGIMPADVILARQSDDLFIVVDQGTSILQIVKHFAATDSQIEYLEFGDGTVWDVAAIQAHIPVATADTMIGTAGNDTYTVDHTGDALVEGANQGVDTVLSSISFNLPANIENLTGTGYLGLALVGNSLNNNLTANATGDSLYGEAGNDTLLGGTGNDSLADGEGYNTLSGGAGDDVYDLTFNYSSYSSSNVTEAPGQGDDTIVVNWNYVRLGYGLPDNIENLTIRTSNTYNAQARITGNSLDNLIEGWDVAVFDGGTGADTMIRHAVFNDWAYGGTFYVDNPGDKVYSGSSQDDVISSVDWTLMDNLDNLTLASKSLALNATGNALNNVIKGNQNQNSLYGLGGDDTLYGYGGSDTLVGGTGNDVYYPGVSDTLVELADGGIDTVHSTNSFTLADNLENLVFDPSPYGSSGTGNALNNSLTGNDGNNTLDGRAGADTMVGYGGDDTYRLDNTGDVVVDTVGTDTVYSQFSYSLPDNLENLVLNGTGDDMGTGNSANNRLDGSQNPAPNRLGGGAGDDTYILGVGDEAVEQVGEGMDTVVSDGGFTLGLGLEVGRLSGSAAADLVGNDADNALYGNDGDNIISGGLGNDTIVASRGHDRIDPGLGNDIVLVSAYVPTNTRIASTAAEAGETDILRFERPKSMVDFTRSGDDLICQADTDGAKVTVEDFYAPGGTLIERIEFGDGSVVLPGDLVFNLIDGSAGNDSLVGTAGMDVMNGLGGNDTLSGAGGSDQLNGGDGNDVLDGGTANDRMAGGVGDDTYWADDSNDKAIENPGEGVDTVYSSAGYSLGDNVENLILTGTAAISGTGNALGNRLVGNSAANWLYGGWGNDTYVVGAGDSVVEYANSGWDTVETNQTYTLGDNVERLVLIGTAAIKGTGNSLNNQLVGNAAANTLTGGAGDDVYYVGVGDTITETGSGDWDVVMSDASWVLGANLEELYLVGTATINGTGNSLDNYIEGNAANNVLNGGVGADILLGGLGNDTYVVDNTDDTLLEEIDEGIDTVQSSIDYQLWDEDNIENLTLTGAAAFSGIGSSLNNMLTGNSVANTLTGAEGNDTLDGGIGGDVMYGDIGDDTYMVDSTADVVSENPGEGLDMVRSGIVYTLVADVENLILTGTAPSGTGNDLDNALTGNSTANTLAGAAGNDILDGGAGADKLYGGTGDDTYMVDATTDVVSENPDGGTDTVRSGVAYTLSANIENLILTGTAAINGAGNALDNALTGNAGNNVLDGGAGVDALGGGAGNDTYVVDALGDTVAENAGEGTDLVQSAVDFILGADLEKLTLTGTASINGTGNALNNTLTGNAGNNALDGGGGADSMAGGAGNDSYTVDGAGDTVTESSGAGTDLVFSYVGYTLSANVENLTLVAGAGNLVATGNSLGNILAGNEGDNILDGGAGADTLTGGGGADLFKFGTVSGGIDIVKDFLSGTDLLLINDLTTGLALGDKDGVIDAAKLTTSPGGFAPSNELVVVTGNIVGAITATSAAAVIGSATSAYAKSYAGLFVVDNGVDSALFKFVSSAADATVSATELTLVGTLQGTASTALSDYAFGT